MSSPFVSIVLIVFNGENYLEDQLESLISQTDICLEIIASDDASTDRSIEILRRYAAKDPRIRVVSNSKNLGFSQNFIAAVSYSRGDYICPCDQDDIWHPQKTRTLLDALGTHDMAYCDSKMINAARSSLGSRSKLSQTRRMISGNEPLAFVFSNTVSGHAMLFRRSLLARALPIPDGFYYDWWLAIVAATGQGIIYVNQPLVQFRRHANTVTTIGGLGSKSLLSMRAYLEERQHMLEAIARLPSSRKLDAHKLNLALKQWLETGNAFWFFAHGLRLCLPLFRNAHFSPLKLPYKIVQYLLAVGSRTK